MRAIFISYRRKDAEGEASHLFGDLRAQFGPDRVFIDVTGVELGKDFRKGIDENVAACGLLLAVIGPGWIDARDEAGHRRLDDPLDFVRLEIASALKRDIPVIPVLVRGAAIPRADQLPEDLSNLSYRNGSELSHTRWDSDVRVLIEALSPHVGKATKVPARRFSLTVRLWVGVAAMVLAAVGIGVYERNKGKSIQPDLAGQIATADKAAADKATADKAAADKAAADRAAADKATAEAAADRAAADRAAADRAAADRAAADRAAADRAAADRAAADKATADKAATDKAAADRAAADKAAAAPQTCSLTVYSDPSGAGVTVDGVTRGQTPTPVQLSQGKTYLLNLKMDGYKPHQERIDCSTARVDVTLEQRLARIIIAYSGDLEGGCNLGVGMEIGGKSFRPTGNPFSANGIPLGDQRYRISGTIFCPATGGCDASGSGSIEVQDGGTYYVAWVKVAPGRCRVELQGP